MFNGNSSISISRRCLCCSSSLATIIRCSVIGDAMADEGRRWYTPTWGWYIFGGKVGTYDFSPCNMCSSIINGAGADRKKQSYSSYLHTQWCELWIIMMHHKTRYYNWVAVNRIDIFDQIRISYRITRFKSVHNIYAVSL